MKDRAWRRGHDTKKPWDKEPPKKGSTSRILTRYDELHELDVPETDRPTDLTRRVANYLRTLAHLRAKQQRLANVLNGKKGAAPAGSDSSFEPSAAGSSDSPSLSL